MLSMESSGVDWNEGQIWPYVTADSSNGGRTASPVQQQDPKNPEVLETPRKKTEGLAKNIGPKRRACNDCRQQKLRCDLANLEDPTQEECSRCKKLGLECKVDDTFKRTRKRKRSGELEKEISELKRQLSVYTDNGNGIIRPIGNENESQTTQPNARVPVNGIPKEPYNLETPQPIFSTTVPNGTSPDSPHHVNISGTTTRPNDTTSEGRPPPPAAVPLPRALGSINLSIDEIEELFSAFFTYHHPFLPILDPQQPPPLYYEESPLLFWSIIAVASRRSQSNPTLLTRLAQPVTDLLWKHIQAVPQTQDIVQSLALLCTWPFPTSSSTTDPSYMMAGIAMQASIQMGLHRPLNLQDFTKFRIRLNEYEIAKRMRSWIACNIVSQSVSIGVGLSAPTQLHDWSLFHAPRLEWYNALEDPFDSHLRIEIFRNHVTQAFTSNTADSISLVQTKERLPLYKLLSNELIAVENSLGILSDIQKFYLYAAKLHFHGFFLFDDPDSYGYTERILQLYSTATSLIQHALETESQKQSFLQYCPFFVYQTFVCASFVLLKILRNDYFCSFLDGEAGKKLFNRSISALRKISITNNDLPGRLSDVLAYLWTHQNPQVISGQGPDGLRLNIQSRMSMSISYDSLWRWRDQFGLGGVSDGSDQLRQETSLSPGRNEAMALFSVDDIAGLAPDDGILEWLQ